MPNNKIKTAKGLQGKGKGSKNLHERSRRVKQTIRVGLREDKVKDGKKRRDRLAMDKTDRLLHFANQLEDGTAALSLEQLHAVVRSYLGRYDASIAEHEKERRPGRPKAKQQERLEQERDEERREYESGFLLPDLTDSAAVKELRHWVDHVGGKTGFLGQLKLIRILKDHPAELVVVQQGSKIAAEAAGDNDEDQEMDEDVEDDKDDE